MKWKQHILKKVLMAVSIWVSLIGIPYVSLCAELPKAVKLVSIESIVTAGDGSATELVIKMSAPATYTSYKTISPLRLVIDFSQVSQGNISAPIAVNKGNFKSVTANRFDTDAGVLTRVEIGLVDDGEAVITSHPSSPGELKIAFPQMAGSNLPIVSNQPVVAAPVVEKPIIPASEPARLTSSDLLSRTLTAIKVDGNAITLALDGPVGEFKTFRLNNPERFVVDVMNTKSGLPSKLLPLNASGVASARIGLYPDKVRVVLDAINGSFPEASAVKADGRIVIQLDSKAVTSKVDTTANSTQSVQPVIEKNVPAYSVLSAMKPEKAPEIIPAAVQEIKPAAKNGVTKQVAFEKQAPEIAVKAIKQQGTPLIDMIDFQVIDGISRVSIKVNGDIAVEKPVKSDGYVTLTIKNTTLPKNLQRSLETRNFVSPVLRVTPLSVKTKKGTDTKIRIATRITAPFEYRQEGDIIYIDFKHPEGMSSDKLFIEATDQKTSSPKPKTMTLQDNELSPDLSSAPDQSVKTSSTSRAYKGRKVTLEFADAEVRKIFQLLSEVSNKNFVLGDEVTGAISLKLVNVPWDQALDIILDTKNLDKREDGNIILIKGKGKFKSQAEEELEVKKLAAKSIELKTETFSINYADLTAITAQFEKLKTPDRGQISSDSRTSKVIVKDTPQALADMRTLLKQLDLPERQVMIEARIVEATSTFSRNLGISWGVHNRDGNATFMGINSMDSSFGGLTSAPPTAGIANASGASMGISFGTLASNIKVDARLNAAASAGMIKIISSPKVATLNHKPAKISQGQQIPYQNTTATTGAVTAFVAATLSLEVTPHINANGTIIMKIDAKNDAPGAGSPPPINTKQATTEMLLRDGETTVIGGIFVDSDTQSDEGVPYLMDIPFFGNLFKTNTKSKVQTELLIFITPRILDTV